MLRTDAFDYDLPPELIAVRPAERRDGSRMMVVDRSAGAIRHMWFREFPSFVREGDIVVLNDVRVSRARFFSDDGRIELLRIGMRSPLEWQCMVRPGRRMRPGDEVVVDGATGIVREVLGDGTRVVAFDRAPDEARSGHLALPPYLRRPDDRDDEERYQTVFSDPDKPGAVAAPTAGLHFTPEMVQALPHAFVTLFVGPGTFQPVRTEYVKDHVMHSEQYSISPGAAQAIESATRRIAVGTTVVRVLEHSARTHGAIVPHGGGTSIFLYPPCTFLRTDVLLTNFHLPGSTLLMLVSAFGGMELIRRAYQEAVAERYRFYSYGDCMLIL